MERTRYERFWDYIVACIATTGEIVGFVLLVGFGIYLAIRTTAFLINIGW